MPANRRVAVELELEAARYIAKGTEVATVMRGVKTQVELLGDEVDELSRDMDQLAVNTDIAKRAVDDLGDEAMQLPPIIAVAAQQVDDLGDEALGTAAALEALDARIEATKLRVRDLGLEFARTNDQGVGKDLKSERSVLRQLSRLREEVAALADEDGGSLGVTLGSAIGTRAGQGMTDSLNDSIMQLPARLRGTAIVAGVGLATLLGPALGGAISGVFSGAVVAGGMAGGIIAASRDTRVRMAWEEFVGGFTAEEFAGGNFVAPTIASIHELQAAWDDLDFGDSLALVSDDVVTLARGVGDMARNFMPGFTRAMERAGPFVGALSEGLATTGGALGTFIDEVSASPGAVMALEATFDTISGTIIFLGKNLRFLSDAFGGMTLASARITGFLEDTPLIGQFLWGRLNDIFEDWMSNVEGVGPAVRIGAIEIEKASEAFELEAEKILEANEALDAYMDLTMDIAATADDFEEAIDNLTQSLKDNGTTIDSGTEKGRANRDAFREAINTAQDYRSKTIELTGATEEANAEFATEIARIEGIASKAGITKQQLLEMAGRYDIVLVLDAAMTAGGRAAVNALNNARRLAGMEFSRQLQEFDVGGRIPGPRGEPQMAIVHGGEYVLSNAMQAGAPTPGLNMGGGGVVWAAPVFFAPPWDAFFEQFRDQVGNRGATLAVLGVRN